jgi:hypothetical protein
MTAYLQRLLDTSAPAAPGLGGPAELVPIAKSASPIFEQDQRLGLAGFEELPLDATPAPSEPGAPMPDRMPPPVNRPKSLTPVPPGVAYPPDPTPAPSAPPTGGPPAAPDPASSSAQLLSEEPLTAAAHTPDLAQAPAPRDRPEGAGEPSAPGTPTPAIEPGSEIHALMPGERRVEASLPDRVGVESTRSPEAPSLVVAGQRPAASLAASDAPPELIVTELPGIVPRRVDPVTSPAEATTAAPDIKTPGAAPLRPVEGGASLRPRLRVDPSDIPSPPETAPRTRPVDRPRVTIDQLIVELLPDPPAAAAVAGAKPTTAEAASVIGPLRSRNLSRRLIALRYR